MKLKLIDVKFTKFKTIKNDNLDIEKDTTCIVGVNEAGKSNVLLGIEFLSPDSVLTAKEISRHSPEYLMDGFTPTIEARFIADSKETQSELDGIFGKKVNEIKLTKTGSEYRVDYPAIDYTTSSFYEEVQKVDDEDTAKESSSSSTELTDAQKNKIRELVNSSVVSLMPNFKYFDSVNFADYYLPLDGEVKISELVATPETHSPVINLLQLANVKPEQLTTYATSEDKIRRTTRLKTASDKINKELLGAFWPIDIVKISLAAEGDILTIRIDDGKDFSPGERSRGLQWALAFNIYFLSTSNGELVNTVLLLDEPGIFLHIGAQKKMLKSTFEKIYKLGNQIVYTTHLPYLIDKDFPEKIRILEKDNSGNTSIGNKAWSQSEYGNIPEPVRTALGVDLTDIIFGEINLVVEGPSDQIYIREYIKQINETLLEKVTIVPAYGAEKVPGVVGLALLSGKKVIGLVDNDKDINSLKSLLSTVGISESYIIDLATISQSDNIKTVEDTAPESIFRSSVYQIYKKETDKRGRNLDKDEIDTTIPRKETTEVFIRQRLTSPKHAFLKMDVARAFSNTSATEEINLKNQEWSVPKKLVSYIDKWANGAKNGTS